MPPITISSSECNQHLGRAKRAAMSGLVVITHRGCPTHVLLSIDEYRRLTGEKLSLGAALAEDERTEFDFEPPRVDLKVEPPDLSV
jgi:prevent-host-death family protein